MNFSKLDNILAREPKFRLKQLKHLIFKDLICDYQEASTLPQILRDKLEKDCPLAIHAKIFVSKDKHSIKALISLHDGSKIESVLMLHRKGRNIVCISSQVGCPLACSFCATGKIGFKRNLDAYEIVEQVIFFARYLKKKGKKVSNVVFMGMGEPFLNYDNVIKAIKVLNDKDGFNLGARRISISSVGISEGIRKLAQDAPQVNLAISLHAPTNELRMKLMPINKQYPLRKVMTAVDYYISKTNRKVMFEYILIKDVNDSVCLARELIKLLKNRLCVLNLIPCNPIGTFMPSPQGKIKVFKSILESGGISVVQRYSFGQDIHAACGQLAALRRKKYL